MGLLLAACAGAPQGERGDPLGALIGREAGGGAALPAAAAGPEPSQYLGRSVAALETLLGQPALVRREGPNEFRRYDLADCRVYAVVAPAGGSVRTLSTGPLTSGEAAPGFSRCTSGL